MKKILIISTGGTIASRLIGGCRQLAPDVSESTLIESFYSNSEYASLSRGIFENSDYSPKTLSENMTPDKLDCLISHLRHLDIASYLGVIILHGTDTLAFTAAFLSMVFSQTPVPIMLVSGDAPPDMECSNANANFKLAFDMIYSGIAPNVYVPYRNTSKEPRLHLASTLMQSPNFSSDFYSAEYFEDFTVASKKRKPLPKPFDRLNTSVILLHPYVGMDYSAISLDGVGAVAHGSYHSGTFCTEGGHYSIIDFSARCKQKGIPLFVAPCTLDENQYQSVFKAVGKASVIPVSMTSEMLYAKLTLALSMKLRGDEITKFVTEEINNEII